MSTERRVAPAGNVGAALESTGSARSSQTVEGTVEVEHGTDEARWVKACGKLPRASPDIEVPSA
jgi:hypothetical protein